jgi:hypothetical protein
MTGLPTINSVEAHCVLAITQVDTARCSTEPEGLTVKTMWRSL